MNPTCKVAMVSRNLALAPKILEEIIGDCVHPALVRAKIKSRICTIQSLVQGYAIYWFDKQMTKFGLFLAALRNAKSSPIHVVPGHRWVAVRIHLREFTTPIHHCKVPFLILMYYYTMAATNCECNLCMHTQAVDSKAMTSEMWSK